MTGQDALSLRLALHRAGYAPLPLFGKKPVFEKWSQHDQTNPDELRMWARSWPDAINTGILTRLTPTLDADILNEDAARAVEDMVREIYDEAGYVLTRLGRIPKRAFLFRTEEPFKKIKIAFVPRNGGEEERLEFLGDGQQVAAFGIHPDTHKPYMWHGGEPGQIAHADLPYIREAEARELIERAAELLVAEHGYVREGGRPHQPKGNGKDQVDNINLKHDHGPVDPDQLRAALVVINSDPYDVWWRVGAALRHELGEAGFGMFDAWSAGSAKYQHEACKKKWRDVGTVTEFTAGTIFYLADQADSGWRKPPDNVRGFDADNISIKPEEAPGVHTDNVRMDEAPSEPPKANGAGAGATTPLNVWSAGKDTDTPPPRGWLLGNTFCRRFLSSLLGDGAVGKSAVRYAQALALATGRNLTGEHIFQRARVLIISLEDDADELRRRIRAARLHFDIQTSDLDGWLFLSSPGAAAGKLMTTDQKGRAVLGQLAIHLETEIVANSIDLVLLDPFVKSHSVEENLNSVIDDIAQVLSDLAAKHNIAIDVPHHISKGAADPGNASRGRGASALVNALRLVSTLTPMSLDEAMAFGIPEDDRRLYVRVDRAKVNIARAAGAAKWFRLVGVPLGNTTELYPAGDEVQTAEPWKPPSTWDDLPCSLLNEILTAIEAGLPDGEFYTEGNKTTGRSAWPVVQHLASAKTEAQCREIIRTWVKNGVLVPFDYTSPTTRKSSRGLKVDCTRRPG